MERRPLIRCGLVVPKGQGRTPLPTALDR
jgi:hypothetical protein